jgi:hypothetical protein
MNQIDLSRQVCENIKQAQLVRLQEGGYSKKEANVIWFRFRRDYLKNWREFVELGLVSLPKDLKRVSTDVINEMIGVKK